jgi:branched-chain amino acid transport system substrate-binding protein
MVLNISTIEDNQSRGLLRRGDRMMKHVGKLLLATSLLFSSSALAEGVKVTVPIIVPITGLLALEGTSQLDGAELAIAHAPTGLEVRSQVIDAGTSAEGGANGLERVVNDKNVNFSVAPLFGTQVLAMLPLALKYKLPLISVTGTAPVTEQGNPYIFRFYPSDATSKAAQVKYAVDVLKRKRAAILYNNTGYGQSGLKYMSEYLAAAGAKTVFSEGIDLSAKSISATLAKMKAANPDVILLQMHSTTLAMAIKQIAETGTKIPVVSNTTIAIPSVTALLQPSELKGVCAEIGSWPVKGADAATDRFLNDYIAKYGAVPHAFATQQYDGLMMVLHAIKSGARTREAIQKYLSTHEYKGVGTTYKSDGKGNMAHSVDIVCYDGSSVTPKLVKRYDNP